MDYFSESAKELAEKLEKINKEREEETARDMELMHLGAQVNEAQKQTLLVREQTKELKKQTSFLFWALIASILATVADIVFRYLQPMR